MGNIRFYIKKLHNFAGYRLYLYFIGMFAISSLEGVGLLMLVPMLSLIGVFGTQSDNALISAARGILDAFPPSMQLSLILVCFAVVLTGQALLQRQHALLSVRIQEGFVRKLRVELYNAILRARWVFFLERQKSDFQHVLTTELGRAGTGTHVTLRLAASLLFTLIQIGLAFWLSPALTGFVLLSGTVLFFVSKRYIRRSGDQGRKTSELSQKYIGGITDQFNGIKDIKSNMLEPVHIEWFRKLSDEMERNVVMLAGLQANSQVLYKTASAICIGGFIYAALTLFRAEPAQLILIMIIFSRLWPRFTGIQASLEQIAVTLPAFRSLTKLQTECEAAAETIEESRLSPPLRVLESLECRNVSFRYDASQTRYALRDISIRIPANRMTAVVGKSGAGKSTLIDMVMGLIRPESGEVLVDGLPLTEGGLRALRQTIGYVSQDPFLFHASIRENLMLVRPSATEEQLWEALRFSASDAFVRRLPQGLDTVIGDRGVRLSGGERQRIVLARAILRKPSILVLDEATSALDTENEKQIQEAIHRLKGSMTVIVIAHRLSTIRHADQVIVLEDGQIIQQEGFLPSAEEKKAAFFRSIIGSHSEMNS